MLKKSFEIQTRKDLLNFCSEWCELHNCGHRRIQNWEREEINRVHQFLAEKDFVNWFGENTFTIKENSAKTPVRPSSRSRGTEDN